MKIIDLFGEIVVGARPSEEACNVIVIELSNGVRLEVISDDVKDKNGDELEDAPR
jgi:hypothetical protein